MKRGFNKADVRQLLQRLIAARNAGSRPEVERLLSAGVRYWDCVHGDVDGRAQAATALLEPAEGHSAESFDVEALAAADDCAVTELRVVGVAPSGPFELVITEVYAVDDDGIASCRAYFDPAALPGRDPAARA